jgi:hypothetical protein
MPKTPESTPSTASITREEIDTMKSHLELIAYHIERMDRRDKIRTIEGFIRSLILIIPTILFIWSTWYFIQHSDEIMAKMTEQITKQTMNYSQQGGEDMMKQLQQMMGR